MRTLSTGHEHKGASFQLGAKGPVGIWLPRGRVSGGETCPEPRRPWCSVTKSGYPGDR